MSDKILSNIEGRVESKTNCSVSPSKRIKKKFVVDASPQRQQKYKQMLNKRKESTSSRGTGAYSLYRRSSSSSSSSSSGLFSSIMKEVQDENQREEDKRVAERLAKETRRQEQLRREKLREEARRDREVALRIQQEQDDEHAARKLAAIERRMQEVWMRKTRETKLADEETARRLQEEERTKERLRREALEKQTAEGLKAAERMQREEVAMFDKDQTRLRKQWQEPKVTTRVIDFGTENAGKSPSFQIEIFLPMVKSLDVDLDEESLIVSVRAVPKKLKLAKEGVALLKKHYSENETKPKKKRNILGSLFSRRNSGSQKDQEAIIMKRSKRKSDVWDIDHLDFHIDIGKVCGSKNNVDPDNIESDYCANKNLLTVTVKNVEINQTKRKAFSGKLLQRLKTIFSSAPRGSHFEGKEAEEDFPESPEEYLSYSEFRTSNINKENNMMIRSHK
eukprot:g2931.t1